MSASLPSSVRYIYVRRYAGLKSRFTGDDGQQCTVEELALQHYATPGGGGWQGV